MAREQALIILEAYPQYADARLMLINIDLVKKHYQAAWVTVNEGLHIDPANQALLQKRKIIYAAVREQRKAVRRQNKLQTEQLPNKTMDIAPVVPTRYLNEIGVYQQQYYISDRHQVWDYSTLYYGRHTELGLIYGKATYDNRLFKQGVQGEIEAYPILTKHVYLDLDFSFANQPNLFPDKAYGAEAYFSIFKAFNYSLGFKYNDVNYNHHFTIYSGSLSKDFGKNRVLFRPYYFTPGVGHNSVLYILDLRHTITDPCFYFGCILGAGKSPDLADLTTVNFIVVKNLIFNPYLNFPLMHERLMVNLGVLLQNQVFENGLVRDWYGGTLGLNWKF